MKDILEEVFLHDAVRGSKAIGFVTMGQGARAQTIGYIVTHESFGAVYVAYTCHSKTFLQPSHLRTIAERLQTLNERQEKAQKAPRP